MQQPAGIGCRASPPGKSMSYECRRGVIAAVHGTASQARRKKKTCGLPMCEPVPDRKGQDRKPTFARWHYQSRNRKFSRGQASVFHLRVKSALP